MKDRIAKSQFLAPLDSELSDVDAMAKTARIIHKRGSHLLIAVMSLGFALSCAVPTLWLTTSPCPGALMEQREIQGTATAVSPLWNSDQWKIVYSNIPFPLVAANETVVLITCRESADAKRQLTALDSATGDVRWISSGVGTAGSLLADEGLVVTITDRRLRTYDLVTGQVIWESHELLGHTRYIMDRDLEPSVEVYWVDDRFFKWEQVISYYDLTSGELIEEARIHAEANTALFLRSHDVDFWAGSDASILARKVHTDEVLWKAGDGRRRLQPWVWRVDDLVVFSTGIFPKLEARETYSGNLSWRYDQPLVSNLVVSGSSIFAIRQDATLIRVDVYTGNVAELVHMEPDETENNTRSIGYWVWLHEGTVFAYYGDSQELFAFSLE